MFLKQAALEPAWSTAFIAKTLGLDSGTAKRLAEQLELAGYSEAVPKKRDSWRNTTVGNKVAGARAPRLTRKTAEELLINVADRASTYPAPIEKIVAFGAINSEHPKIQDIDLSVKLAAGADREEIFKAIRGKSPSLKVRALEGWLETVPGREIMS